MYIDSDEIKILEVKIFEGENLQIYSMHTYVHVHVVVFIVHTVL